jgi:hypothetical protein
MGTPRTRLYLIAIAICICTVLFSCSPQARYNRFIKKHPELVLTDTIWLCDTFVIQKKILVPEYKDSFIIQKDTIIETKRFVITKYQDKFKVVYKADTILYRDTVKINIPVAGRIIKESKTNWNYTWIALIMGLIIGLVFSTRR